MDKIGFVGLGSMGSAMARNIHKNGFSLAVHNRTRASTEPFREMGVPVCETPKAVAGRSDVIIIMVTGPDALHEVISGAEGIAAGLTAGKVVVNMSTVSAEASLEAAAIVKGKGANFVDAPVSGTVKPAEEGTLVVLASGETGTVSRVMPVLKSMGNEVVNCGDIGQGTRMKLVLNLLLGNMMQSLAEAMMLGRQFDLDAETVLHALASSAMGAPIFQMKGQAILNGSFDKQFPVHLMFKDLNLVLEAAGKSHTPLPQTASTRECFSAAMARGLGDQDMAAVMKVLELLADKRVRD